MLTVNVTDTALLVGSAVIDWKKNKHIQITSVSSVYSNQNMILKVVYVLHLFSKLRDLCSWHLKGISCVLAAVNQTSDDLFLFKKAQNNFKVSNV